MLSEWLRQLPYLVHTNRELGLMLRGIKPLSYFMEAVGYEPDLCIRYWRMFDRHVAAGVPARVVLEFGVARSPVT
jgi:hypothetical protein